MATKILVVWELKKIPFLTITEQLIQGKETQCNLGEITQEDNIYMIFNAL